MRFVEFLFLLSKAACWLSNFTLFTWYLNFEGTFPKIKEEKVKLQQLFQNLIPQISGPSQVQSQLIVSPRGAPHQHIIRSDEWHG